MNNKPATIDRWATEPFRIFFPLGLIASVFGAMLWPAFSQGWIVYYPLEEHARWMTLGFGGCFIAGFLGTAGPRFLDAPPWRRWELVVHLSMALAMMICLAFNRITVADLLAGLWLLGLLASLLYRFFYERLDFPPPGLPMAALGLFSAGIAGVVLSLATVVDLPLQLYIFFRLLYFQGLLWLPVIAVAPYLLPRFFGKDSPHEFDESKAVPAGWSRKFVASLIAGLLLIATFACEAWLDARVGMVLRGILVMLYLFISVPGLAGWTRSNGLGVALRWVVPCAAAGWFLAASFPFLRNGMLHLMFIGGAGLLILTVATRVNLGHSGRGDRLKTPLRWFHVVWTLLLFTAATRLSAEFIPKVRISHLTYAAVAWSMVLVFWVWKLRREGGPQQHSGD